MRQLDPTEKEDIETLSRAIAMVLTNLMSLHRPSLDHQLVVRPSAKASEETLIDVATAAKQLGVGRTAIYGLVRSRAIPSVRLGRVIRIRRAALMAWIEESEKT
jgi:excisionase family DNA binding protein